MMFNILSLFGWTTWLLIIFIVIFLFWLVYGGKQEYEFVGVKPLTTQGLFEKNLPQYDFSEELIEIPEQINTFKPVEIPKTNKGEDIVFEVLQNILETEIQRNVRPDFLKNPETGCNLELDCFAEEYAIAVEYNGIQHYKYPSAFHSSETQFLKQVQRDRLKKRLCDEAGVYLIPVPYWVDIYESKESHIKDKNQTFKPIFVPRQVRYERIYNYLYSKISEYFKIIFPQEQNEQSEDFNSGWSQYSVF